MFHYLKDPLREIEQPYFHQDEVTFTLAFIYMANKFIQSAFWAYIYSFCGFPGYQTYYCGVASTTHYPHHHFLLHCSFVWTQIFLFDILTRLFSPLISFLWISWSIICKSYLRYKKDVILFKFWIILYYNVIILKHSLNVVNLERTLANCLHKCMFDTYSSFIFSNWSSYWSIYFHTS